MVTLRRRGTALRRDRSRNWRTRSSRTHSPALLAVANWKNARISEISDREPSAVHDRLTPFCLFFGSTIPTWHFRVVNIPKAKHPPTCLNFAKLYNTFLDNFVTNQLIFHSKNIYNFIIWLSNVDNTKKLILNRPSLSFQNISFFLKLTNGSEKLGTSNE